MRICGVLICYHFLLNRRSSNVLSYVYWTNVCYTLIDLLACVPYYSMHVLNKHEGLSKKKKLMLHWPKVVCYVGYNVQLCKSVQECARVCKPPILTLAIASPASLLPAARDIGNSFTNHGIRDTNQYNQHTAPVNQSS